VGRAARAAPRCFFYSARLRSNTNLSPAATALAAGFARDSVHSRRCGHLPQHYLPTARFQALAGLSHGRVHLHLARSPLP